MAQALDAEPVRLGSAGAKAMTVVNGETDIYVHDGGMYQWDSAAPAAVALAAGLHASRIDGSPIVYNQPRPVAAGHDRLPPGVATARPGRTVGLTGGAEGDPLRGRRAVATVWLHRPHRHNVWTGRMHAEYRWVLAQLAADSGVRVVVRDRHAAGVLRGR